MPARSFEGKESIPLADGYELDLRPRRLRRGSRVLKLERIPLEVLFLLVEHNGEIVSRDQIVSRIWGPGVFLDTDNSIRGAISKLRRVLKDNAETPHFIQTVTGQGYRFIAPVITARDPTPEKAIRAGGAHTALFGVVGLLSLVLMVVTLVAVRAWRRPADPSAASRQTVLAILPFANLSRDPSRNSSVRWSDRRDDCAGREIEP
jgi:DNA-binding winged helix-turn-helix (wHTH) protein